MGARTGGERGNRMLCARDTEVPDRSTNFFGGGDGFCVVAVGPSDGGGGFGASIGLPNFETIGSGATVVGGSGMLSPYVKK